MEKVLWKMLSYIRIVGQSGFQEIFMEYDLVSWNAIVSSQFLNKKGLEYTYIDVNSPVV